MKKILFMGDSITDAQRDRESDAYMYADNTWRATAREDR